MQLTRRPGTCQFNFLNENIFLNPLAGAGLVNTSLQWDTNTGCALLVGRHGKAQRRVQLKAVTELCLGIKRRGAPNRVAPCGSRRALGHSQHLPAQFMAPGRNSPVDGRSRRGWGMLANFPRQ